MSILDIFEVTIPFSVTLIMRRFVILKKAGIESKIQENALLGWYWHTKGRNKNGRTI